MDFLLFFLLLCLSVQLHSLSLPKKSHFFINELEKVRNGGIRHHHHHRRWLCDSIIMTIRNIEGGACLDQLLRIHILSGRKELVAGFNDWLSEMIG